MSNVALNKNIEESIGNPRLAVDGNITDYSQTGGFAYFIWPGNLTLDLNQEYPLKAIRILLWDDLGNNRTQRHPMSYNYRLLISTDHNNWKLIHDTANNPTNGWQVFIFNQRIQVRYIRIHGLNNSYVFNRHISIVQIEAHDEEPPELQTEIRGQRTINISELDNEEGDGLPFTNKIRSMINQLADLISQNNLINPDPINELISDLRIRVKDISAIERDMNSIKREITQPVSRELQRSARISSGSLIVGIIGGIIGIIAIIMNMFCR